MALFPRTALLLSLLLLPAGAWADKGDYGGVQPGKGMPPPDSPKAPKRKIPARPTVLWVGFKPQDGGGARVFLQLNTVPSYQQTVAGDSVLVHVAGVVLDTHNDTRPLDTHFFPTPIAGVVARAAKGGVDVKISFKKDHPAHEAAASVAQGDDGLQYLYLDFTP